MTVVDIYAEDSRIEEVIALGDANKGSLGFLPYAGFYDAAAKGRLLAAYQEQKLLGYCLFDLPDKTIRLVHLCVSEDGRERGVARALVDHLSGSFPDRSGIRLKCRTDWAANTIWRHLDFVPVRDVPGRSAKGSILTIWWRAHDVPDLFSDPSPEGEGSVIAIDTDVLNDFVGDRTRAGSEFSRALLTPWAAGDIDIVVLPGVRHESYGTPDPKVRDRLLNRAAAYGHRLIDRAAVTKIRDSIAYQISGDVLLRDSSLVKDCWNVAEAIVARVDAFVTRDDNLLKYVAPVAISSYGLPVLHSAEASNFLDAQRRSDLYLPDRLFSTSYEMKRTPADHYGDGEQFLCRDGGEKLAHLKKRLRSLASRATGDVGRWTLSDQNGRTAAVWSLELDFEKRRALQSLHRVGKGPLQATISRQIITLAKRMALANELSTVVIEDSKGVHYMHPLLEAEGFRRENSGTWTAPVIDIAGPWATVIAHPALRESVEAKQDVPDQHAASDLERRWWPAKILDSELQSYIAPINSRFAVMLFGHRDTLFAREDELGLSREHVFYKSPANRPDAPSRVLWYSSGEEQLIIGCSRITEVVIGRPSALHQQFARLGVWGLDDIEGVAKGGVACALRFEDTEIFDTPISLQATREVLGKGHRFSIQSRYKITSAEFADLYARGRRR